MKPHWKLYQFHSFVIPTKMLFEWYGFFFIIKKPHTFGHCVVVLRYDICSCVRCRRRQHELYHVAKCVKPSEHSSGRRGSSVNLHSTRITIYIYYHPLSSRNTNASNNLAKQLSYTGRTDVGRVQPIRNVTAATKSIYMAVSSLCS